jgi:hypothetical protein
MRGPAVHVPHERTERDVVHKVFHVVVRILGRRTVVKHQDDACDRKNNEKEKSDPAHPPRETDVCRVARDANGMEMQEHIVDDLKRPVPLCVLVVVAENGLVDIRFLHFFAKRIEYAEHRASILLV